MTRNWPRTKRNVVVDASSLVGALLKQGSLPDQAVLLAAKHGCICLSRAVLLAADAAVIVSSDADLLALHPWRGIDILTPADFVARFT